MRPPDRDGDSAWRSAVLGQRERHRAALGTGILDPDPHRDILAHDPVFRDVFDDDPPIAAGREIWGFPKKYAHPKLEIVKDTLTGTLSYANQLVAMGTMGYKHKALDLKAVAESLEVPNYLLKIIPCTDGTPRILELIDYRLEDVVLKGAWTGPAALDLRPHALAPVAQLPVIEVISATHILADLTLGLGKVIYDYLKP